jgi:hypothetical protein
MLPFLAIGLLPQLALGGSSPDASRECVFARPITVSPRPTVPPYAELRLSWGVQGTIPVAGDLVTVLAPDGSPGVEVPITSVLRRDDVPEAGTFWEVELRVTEPRLLALPARADRRPERPFDLVVVQPAAPGARLLPAASLGDEDRPRGIGISQVLAAVAFGGGDRPAVVTAEWCCQAPTLAADVGPCPSDLTCGGTWVRRAQAWVQVDDWSPM